MIFTFFKVFFAFSLVFSAFFVLFVVFFASFMEFFKFFEEISILPFYYFFNPFAQILCLSSTNETWALRFTFP